MGELRHFPPRARSLDDIMADVAKYRDEHNRRIEAEGEQVWNALKEHESEHPTLSPFRAGFLVGIWAGSIATCAFALLWGFIR